MNFNLIATTYRNKEYELMNELRQVLSSMGDTNPTISLTPIPGLVLCLTSLDTLNTIDNLKKVVEEEPWKIRFILRLIPIQRVVKTDLENIREEVLKLANLINEGESYKIEIEKRFTNIHKRELINTIAPYINRTVKLDEPDWIILIEIVNLYTGLSLIKKEYIFSLEKVKRLIY